MSCLYFCMFVCCYAYMSQLYVCMSVCLQGSRFSVQSTGLGYNSYQVDDIIYIVSLTSLALKLLIFGSSFLALALWLQHSSSSSLVLFTIKNFKDISPKYLHVSLYLQSVEFHPFCFRGFWNRFLEIISRLTASVALLGVPETVGSRSLQQ